MSGAAIPAGSRRRLVGAARAAARAAYAPYSRFPVGAAVLAASGKVYSGCNVENASYGLGTCAERNAIASAVAAGERRFKAVVVYTPTAAPTPPCGACRQFLSEFGGTTRVLCVCDTRASVAGTAASLLPAAFVPADLLRSRRPGRRK